MEVLATFGTNNWFAQVDRQGIRTTLYDGSQTYGVPPDIDGFKESAAYLGYGDDTYHHMIEHDLCHLYLAEWIDNAPPAALWNQAHDERAYLKKAPPSVVRDEEIVEGAQLVLNHNDQGLAKMAKYVAYPKQFVERLRTIIRPNGLLMSAEWAANAEPINTRPVLWEGP